MAMAINDHQQLGAPLDPFISDVRPEMQHLSFRGRHGERWWANGVSIVVEPLDERNMTVA